MPAKLKPGSEIQVDLSDWGLPDTEAKAASVLSDASDQVDTLVCNLREGLSQYIQAVATQAASEALTWAVNQQSYALLSHRDGTVRIRFYPGELCADENSFLNIGLLDFLKEEINDLSDDAELLSALKADLQKALALTTTTLELEEDK